MHANRNGRWAKLVLIVGLICFVLIGLMVRPASALTANPDAVCAGLDCTVTFGPSADIYEWVAPADSSKVWVQLEGSQDVVSGAHGDAKVVAFWSDPRRLTVFVAASSEIRESSDPSTLITSASGGAALVASRYTIGSSDSSWVQDDLTPSFTSVIRHGGAPAGVGHAIVHYKQAAAQSPVPVAPTVEAPSPTAIPTASPSPSETLTPTPAPTPSPSETPSPTPTPSQTASPVPQPAQVEPSPPTEVPPQPVREIVPIVESPVVYAPVVETPRAEAPEVATPAVETLPVQSPVIDDAPPVEPVEPVAQPIEIPEVMAVKTAAPIQIKKPATKRKSQQTPERYRSDRESIIESAEPKNSAPPAASRPNILVFEAIAFATASGGLIMLARRLRRSKSAAHRGKFRLAFS